MAREEILKPVGERLKQLLKPRGIVATANLLLTSPNSLYRNFKGEDQLGLLRILKIQALTDVDLNWLLLGIGGEGPLYLYEKTEPATEPKLETTVE